MRRFLMGMTLIAVATLSFSQSPQARDYTLSVHVELVQLPVFVLDQKGEPVRGLRPEYFSVYEDKVQQDISLFKQEDVPLSIGLVIDASSSMRQKRDRLNTAAMTFFHESNSDDETFIVGFADAVTLEQDFTRSTNQLAGALNRMPSNGNTALYDAVQLAAEHLETGSREKKVLIVVSDGEDNKSRYKLDEVLQRIRESKIVLYSVGLLTDSDVLFNSGPFAGKAKRALKEMADVTGGRSFFPKDVSDVQEVCRRIAHDLRNQYTIGYKPSNENLDGSWRKISVRVDPPKGAPKVKVRAKQGYYAPLVANAQPPVTPTTLK